MSTLRYMLIRDTFTDIKVNIFYSAITNQARVNEGHFTLLLVPSIKKKKGDVTIYL